MRIRLDNISIDRPNNIVAWGHDYSYGRIRCTCHIKTQQYTISTDANGLTTILNDKGLKSERHPYYFFTNKADCEEVEFESITDHLNMLMTQIKKYKTAASGLVKKTPQLSSTQEYQDLMVELHKPL